MIQSDCMKLLSIHTKEALNSHAQKPATPNGVDQLPGLDAGSLRCATPTGIFPGPPITAKRP